MKIRRDIIRPTGLTVVYEPDVPSDDPGLDIIFIHGVGGHPIKTWLYTPPTPIPLSPDAVTTTTTISGGTLPSRSQSLRSWVSPRSGGKKASNTIKKFQYSPSHRHQQQYYAATHGGPYSPPPGALLSSASPSPAPGGASDVTPWESNNLSGNGGGGGAGGRRRLVAGPPRSSGERPFSTTEATPEHFHERLIFSGRPSPAAAAAARHQRSLPSPSPSPSPSPVPVPARRLFAGGSRSSSSHRPLTRQQLLDERKAAATAAQYWPQDLLPTSCPHARVLVWGFKTVATYEAGLVAGQFDVFTRGRQLLENLDELRREPPRSPGSGPGPGRGGKRREVLFVAHSTGGIIVKEMLRLASSFSDTHDEDLLASIAGVVFLGCPLRDSTHDGDMVDAMRSMAGYATGCSTNDEALREVLGGSEDDHLAVLGKEAFDAVRNEYNFPVKMYRETRVGGPWNDWTERSLRLRREASCLEDDLRDVEDIKSDHVGMAKFASSSNESYESIASFIVKLAHYQSLKARPLTDRDKAVAQALDILAPTRPEPEAEAAPKAIVAGRAIPQWLLNHPHTQSWLRRSKNGDKGGASKVLWLAGPTGSARSELLTSLRRYVQTRWAPATHSSIIISIKAGQDQPPLESVQIGASDYGLGQDAAQVYKSSPVVGDRTIEATASRAASADETPAPAQPQYLRATSSAIPAGALRSLLSQLYAHDARLRNLVRKQGAHAATAGSLHGEVFETPPYQSRDHGHKLNATTNNSSSSTANDTGEDKVSRNLHLLKDTPGTIIAGRRWSDPIGSTSGSLSDVQARDWQLVEQEAKAGRTIGRQVILEDADVVNLFLDDYLGIDSTAERQSNGTSASTDPAVHHRIGVKDDHNTIQVPGIRRVFILVDAAEICGKESVRELLWYLELLAARSDFSICVATMELEVIDWAELNGDDKWQQPMSDTLLPVVIPENNAEEIRQYVGEQLVPDMGERDAIATKIVDRAGGLRLWAELAVSIVNDASEEGVSGEVILSMIDDITPPRQCTKQGKLNALYSWKLSRMNRTEMSQALVLMQWVMLSPEPLRLNELLVAMRLTMLTWPRAGLVGWDMKKTLEVEPAMSLKDLRKSTSGERGITMDSPLLFWRWIQKISQGLLRLESAESDEKISSKPLALQRVLPADESVQLFFLQGKGFQCLLPLPEDAQEKPPSTERFIDSSYGNMLHACLLYLNMTDLESLSRGAKPLKPMPDDLPLQEKTKWRKNAEDQRRMVMSSYPFLRYVVDNLVFHLLCPRAFRYFLPQKEFLQLFTANRCRIWRRWTHLLGFSIADADPSTILSRASQGAAKSVLDPVYGAKYRLERVLRKVWKTAQDQQLIGMPGSARTSPRMHLRSRSELSENSMVFTLVGSDDPEKAQWLVPTSPRSRSASSPAAPSPRSPKSPMTPVVTVPLSPRFLAGIQELI